MPIVPGNFPIIPRDVTLSSARKADIDKTLFDEVKSEVNTQFRMKSRQDSAIKIAEDCLKFFGIPYSTQEINTGIKEKLYYVGDEQSRKWYGTAIIRFRWNDAAKEYLIHSYFPYSSDTRADSKRRPVSNNIETMELANAVADAIGRYRAAVEHRSPSKKEDADQTAAAIGCTALLLIGIGIFISFILWCYDDCTKNKQQTAQEYSVQIPFRDDVSQDYRIDFSGYK